MYQVCCCCCAVVVQVLKSESVRCDADLTVFS